MTTPEVGARLVAQQGFIFDELLLEEHAGFKGIQAEHALTEAVDSEHGGLVHLPFRQQQPLGRLLCVVNLVQQTGIQRIVRALSQAGDPQLVNVGADTAAQLFRRGFGEGHHQQLFHAERATEGCAAAQPEQQAQIECGDGEGFSGSR